MNDIFWPLAFAIGIPIGITLAMAWLILRPVFEERGRVKRRVHAHQFPEIDESLLPEGHNDAA